MKCMVPYKELYESKDLIMWLDISTYCNASCPQCHRTSPDGLEKNAWLPLVQWSFSDFKKIFPVETMKHVKKFDLCGTWGDPVMNKDIFEICEYIIENSDAVIDINTNGSMRNEEWWWNFAVMGGKRLTVTFTIDGSTQEIHSLYRQNTNLNTILNHMQIVNMGGANSSVFTVVFKHNQDDLINIANLCVDHGANHIIFVISNRFHKRNSKEFNFRKNNSMHKLVQTDLPENIQENINYRGFGLNEIHRIERILNGK